MENIHKILSIEFLISAKRKFKLSSILLLSLLFVSSSLIAQNRRVIKGQVIDEKKQPLIGATVIGKGLKNVNTITDVDGNFTLSIPADNKQSIMVSYIGYEPQEVSISSKTSITVIMTENSTQMGEVVVVGFGQQKKASVVG